MKGFDWDAFDTKGEVAEEPESTTKKKEPMHRLYGDKWVCDLCGWKDDIHGITNHIPNCDKNPDKNKHQDQGQDQSQEKTSDTRVVNLTKESYDVYIGREWHLGGHDLVVSKWANPFDKRHGTVEYSRQYITKERPDLLAALPKLRGKRLGCWRKPGPCHGDVLIELLEREWQTRL